MVFNYGPQPPPEPTPAQVFDALAAASDGPVPSTPPAPAAPAAPSPPRAPASTGGAALAGLDTGRFDVGEVEIDDVPGLIDSRLFGIMTPAHVDVAPVPGLELTMQAERETIAVQPTTIPGLERRDDGDRDVQVAAVPGLFSSDLFRTDVDVQAGAAASTAVLEVSPNAASRIGRRPESERHRVVCATCSSVHFLARCPSCGTAVIDHDEE